MTAKRKERWYDNPISAISASVPVLIFIASLGYYIGTYRTEVDFKIGASEQTLACSTLVAAEKDKCAELRVSLQEKEISEIKSVVYGDRRKK